MKLSLMTLDMFIRIYYRCLMQRDMETARKLYEEMMRNVRGAGFDTVEVTSRETDLFGLEAVKAVLHENELSAGGYMYMDSLDEPAEKVMEAARTAEALGADILMLIPYWHASLAGKSRDEIHEVYAARWQKAAELAAEKGIQAVVEDTPDQRIHFCRAEDLKHFLGLVPSMKLIYDSGNMILAGEDPLLYAETMKDQIACVHLKDMKLVPADQRGADIALDGRHMSSARHGDGLIPLREVVRKLRDQGYCGRWVAELSMDGSGSNTEAIDHVHGYMAKFLGNETY